MCEGNQPRGAAKTGSGQGPQFRDPRECQCGGRDDSAALPRGHATALAVSAQTNVFDSTEIYLLVLVC